MTFEYRNAATDRLAVAPLGDVVWLKTTPGGCEVPPDRVEEVVAGIRDAARQAAGQTTGRTPCSTPNPCEDGELCDVHETEQAHAEGEHAFCGQTCEVEFPSEKLRNFILAKGYPGTGGALNELLRRAAARRPAVEQPAEAQPAEARRALLLELVADAENNAGYITVQELRRMAGEQP